MKPLLRRHPGLRGFPHVDLGVRPTAVDRLEIGGLSVLVKRDDRTSDVYGGNKVRSLEFLLAGAPRRLLTFTALGAHHGYAVAVHGRRLGIPAAVVVVRRGRREALLERLERVADRCVEVGGVAGAVLASVRLWRPGTRIIPPGGASPRGALGYVVTALELETVPERIYVALGTGTTVSGLLAGLALRGAATEVVAVRVADVVAGWPRLLWRRAFAALRLLRRHDPSIPEVGRGGVRLRVVAAEGAYGEPTPSTEAAVIAARPLELETTYTGKTLARLLADRADGAMLIDTYAPAP
jgi:D-cysteine desulfhydrase